MNLLAALRALPLVCTLAWALTAWAQPAGTSGKASPQDAAKSAVLPSIEILAQQSDLAGSCGGPAFNLNTYIHVDTQASSQVQLSAPGFPILEQFTDETGSNIGPFNGTYPAFTILPFGGGLPPNTPILVVVNTYTGKALSGTVSYTSAIQFDCTTGVVQNLVAAPPGASSVIPTLSKTALAAMTLLLMAAALLTLRRRAAHGKPPESARRPR